MISEDRGEGITITTDNSGSMNDTEKEGRGDPTQAETSQDAIEETGEKQEESTVETGESSSGTFTTSESVGAAAGATAGATTTSSKKTEKSPARLSKIRHKKSTTGTAATASSSATGGGSGTTPRRHKSSGKKTSSIRVLESENPNGTSKTDNNNNSKRDASEEKDKMAQSERVSLTSTRKSTSSRRIRDREEGGSASDKLSGSDRASFRASKTDKMAQSERISLTSTSKSPSRRKIRNKEGSASDKMAGSERASFRTSKTDKMAQSERISLTSKKSPSSRKISSKEGGGSASDKISGSDRGSFSSRKSTEKETGNKTDKMAQSERISLGSKKSPSVRRISSSKNGGGSASDKMGASELVSLVRKTSSRSNIKEGSDSAAASKDQGMAQSERISLSRKALTAAGEKSDTSDADDLPNLKDMERMSRRRLTSGGSKGSSRRKVSGEAGSGDPDNNDSGKQALNEMEGCHGSKNSHSSSSDPTNDDSTKKSSSVRNIEDETADSEVDKIQPSKERRSSRGRSQGTSSGDERPKTMRDNSAPQLMANDNNTSGEQGGGQRMIDASDRHSFSGSVDRRRQLLGEEEGVPQKGNDEATRKHLKQSSLESTTADVGIQEKTPDDPVNEQESEKSKSDNEDAAAVDSGAAMKSKKSSDSKKHAKEVKSDSSKKKELAEFQFSQVVFDSVHFESLNFDGVFNAFEDESEKEPSSDDDACNKDTTAAESMKDQIEQSTSRSQNVSDEAPETTLKAPRKTLKEPKQKAEENEKKQDCPSSKENDKLDKKNESVPPGHVAVWICKNCNEEHDEAVIKFCGLCGADRPKKKSITPQPKRRMRKKPGSSVSPKGEGARTSHQKAMAQRPASTGSLRKVRSKDGVTMTPRSRSKGRARPKSLTDDDVDESMVIKCLDGGGPEVVAVDLELMNQQFDTFDSVRASKSGELPQTPSRGKKMSIRRSKSDVTGLPSSKPSAAPPTPSGARSKSFDANKTGKAPAAIPRPSARKAIPRRAKSSSTEYLQQLQQQTDLLGEGNADSLGLSQSAHTIGVKSGVAARGSMLKAASSRFLGAFSKITKKDDALLLNDDSDDDDDEFANDAPKDNEAALLVDFPGVNMNLAKSPVRPSPNLGLAKPAIRAPQTDHTKVNAIFNKWKSSSHGADDKQELDDSSDGSASKGAPSYLDVDIDEDEDLLEEELPDPTVTPRRMKRNVLTRPEHVTPRGNARDRIRRASLAVMAANNVAEAAAKPKPAPMMTPGRGNTRERIRRASLTNMQQAPDPGRTLEDVMTTPGRGKQRGMVRRASLSSLDDTDSKPEPPKKEELARQQVPRTGGRRRRASLGGGDALLQRALQHIPDDPMGYVRDDVKKEWQQQERLEEMRKQAATNSRAAHLSSVLADGFFQTGSGPSGHD